MPAEKFAQTYETFNLLVRRSRRKNSNFPLGSPCLGGKTSLCFLVGRARGAVGLFGLRELSWAGARGARDAR
jgi:hypothetical protein